MAVSFLTVDRQTIARRLEAAFDAAVDGQGRMLFPDHRIPGSPGYNLRRLMEQEVLRWHQEANAALSAMSPLTASGAFLDAWAAFFGMERGRARVARGRVRLVSQMAGADMERLLGSRLLPVGTRLSTGSVELELEEDAVFPDEDREVVVGVRARWAGSGVDLPEGVALELVSSTLRGFVRAEVVERVTGGASEETDEQLRYRLAKALVEPSTMEGFRVLLETHPLVASVELTPAAFGPGTLEVFVRPAVVPPPVTLRQELEALYRGSGQVYVVLPEIMAVEIRLRYSGQAPDVELLADYVRNLPLGEPLVLSRLEERALQLGTSDAQVVGLRTGRWRDGRVVFEDVVPVVNLALPSRRAVWYTQSDWIHLCTG